MNPEILEFLVAKGLYGMVAKKYEAYSLSDLLHLTEKRVLRRDAGLV